MMLIELAPGKAVEANEVVAVTDEKQFSYSIVTLRNGARVTVPGIFDAILAKINAGRTWVLPSFSDGSIKAD